MARFDLPPLVSTTSAASTPAVSALSLVSNPKNSVAPKKLSPGASSVKITSLQDSPIFKIVSSLPPIQKLAGTNQNASQDLQDHLRGKQIVDELTERGFLKPGAKMMVSDDKNNLASVDPTQNYRLVGKSDRFQQQFVTAAIGAINEGGVAKSAKDALTKGAKGAEVKAVEEATAKSTAKTLPAESSLTKQTVPQTSLPPTVPPEPTPVQKVINALQEAEPIRGQQETIYSRERAARLAKSVAVGEKTTGEAGFYSELGQLKGELPKVQFENIRSKVTQADIDSLFNQIKDTPLLGEWDKIAARKALGKIFGEFGGTVPTEGELQLLNKAFGPDFVSAIMDKRGLFQKFKELALQIANVPRSLMASFDLSAPFRQGLFMVGRPKQFFPAFVDMFKSFGSEKAFTELQASIVRRPTFELMRDSKLALTNMDRILTSREEQFMSNLAEKIPLAGRVVRASGRAYTGFLNKLRADVFDDLVSKAESQGLNPKNNLDLTHAISNFVNTATGRGSLGAFERAAPMLNSFFFSPRLMASRLNLLNPVYYAKQPAFVRREALKSLFSTASTLLSVLGLAKMAGAEVGIDPRNSDFGKIKIGNTRVDIAGGFQQYLVMAARIITGKYISSTTGKEYTLGEGYKPTTRLDILTRGIEAKEAPLFSFFSDILRGQDAGGNPINLPTEVGNLFVPILIRDLIDLAKSNPELLPLGLPAAFGTGVQTYGPKKTTSSAGRFKF